jgi:hypothetical protein
VGGGGGWAGQCKKAEQGSRAHNLLLRLSVCSETASHYRRHRRSINNAIIYKPKT